MENHLRFLFFTTYFLGLFALAMLHHLFAARLQPACRQTGLFLFLIKTKKGFSAKQRSLSATFLLSSFID